MQFNVPKFIEIEDKIFGPLTFKQFVYLAGGAGLSALIWWILPQILAIPVVIVVVAFSLALAFYRVNNKPFIHTVQAALQYLSNARLYVWKQRTHPNKSSERLKKEAEQIKQVVPDSSSEDRIKRKSWSIQVQKNNDEVAPRSDIKLSKPAPGSES